MFLLRRAHPPLQEEPDSTSLSSHYAVVGTPSAWMEPKNGPRFQHQPLCNPAISSPWNKLNSPSMTLENPAMFSGVCLARGSRVKYHTAWLRQHIHCSQRWRVELEIQVWAGLVPLEGSLVGVSSATSSLCVHMATPLCVSIS